MFLQGTLLLLGGLGIHVALVGHERHLRVDDGILSLWIVQNDVGLHLATRLVVLQRTPHLVAQTGLHLVMDTLGESLRRQQVAKNDFTHVAANLVVATQHVGQSLGLLAHLAARFHHQAQLFLQRCRLGCMVLGVVADGLSHFADGLLQGLRDVVYALLILFIQVTGLCLGQQHTHVVQLVLGGFHHVYLRLLLSQFHHQPRLLRVHHEVDPHSPQGYTYYYIYYNHHLFNF